MIKGGGRTIVRPGLLTNGLATGGRALTEPADWRAGSVSRADVADLLVSEAFERARRQDAALINMSSWQ